VCRSRGRTTGNRDNDAEADTRQGGNPENFQASASANLPKHAEIENYEALQVSESAMLFTGQNVFFQTRDGKEVPTLARFTFLITKVPQGRSIGHFHSSRRPEAQ
jgi:hypothetical protein